VLKAMGLSTLIERNCMSDPVVNFKNRFFHMWHQSKCLYKACENALVLFEVCKPIFVGNQYCYKAVEMCNYFIQEIDEELNEAKNARRIQKLKDYKSKLQTVSNDFYQRHQEYMAG
jgi:hypothetical protein